VCIYLVKIAYTPYELSRHRLQSPPLRGYSPKSSLAHAEPVLAPIPAQFKSQSIASPSIPRNEIKIVFGVRFSLGVTTKVSGILRSSSSNPSRSSLTSVISKSKASTACSIAFPIPTIPATFRVPERSPPICEPPWNRGISSLPFFIIESPNPLWTMKLMS